jgi:hypothetical protein
MWEGVGKVAGTGVTVAVNVTSSPYVLPAEWSLLRAVEVDAFATTVYEILAVACWPSCDVAVTV